MSQQIQLRRDTAANWTAANPLLAQGELGVEVDTAKIKLGTGLDNWNSLGYFSATQSTYTFVQSSASSTWTISHGLGRFPSVTVVDTSNRQIEGDVTYTGDDNITISFSVALMGTAYLN